MSDLSITADPARAAFAVVTAERLLEALPHGAAPLLLPETTP